MNGLTVGQIAREAEVDAWTVRFYEKEGLLPKPKRTSAGYRLYDVELAERIRFIKKAQHLGLKLDEVREILELSDRGRCPCRHVQTLLKKRLNELQRKIADLRLIEQRVKGAIRQGSPPNFKPKGRAICPMIQRQS